MADKLHKVLATGTSVQNAFENDVEHLLESGNLTGDILPKPQKGSTKKVEGYKKEKAVYAKSENAQTYEKVFLVKAGDKTLEEFKTITEAKKFAQAHVLENKTELEIHVEHRVVEGDAVYATVAYQPETLGQWELVIVEEIADEVEETEEEASDEDEDTEVEATEEDADEDADEADETDEDEGEDEQTLAQAAE